MGGTDATLLLGFDVLQYSAVLGAALAVAALIAALTTRAVLARRLARASTVACAIVVAMWLGWLVYGFGMIANAETSSKATLLAETISCLISCTALVGPALVIGALAWWIARSRARVDTPARLRR